MNPDITIVIPYYNGSKHIAGTVDSVKALSHSKEILIIDDGSSPDEACVPDDLYRDDDEITVIHKANGGIVSARNEGLRLALGRFVFFCDQDDTAVSEVIDRALDMNSADPCHITFWSTVMTYEADRPDRRCDTVTADTVVEGTEIPEVLLKQILTQSASEYGHKFSHLWMGLYDRQLIINENISFKSFISIDDDLIFIMDAVAAAKRVRLISDIGYKWLQNFGSESHTSEWTEDFLNKTIAHFKYYDEVAMRGGCSSAVREEVKAFTDQATVTDAMVNWASMPRGDDADREKRAIIRLLDLQEDEHIWDTPHLGSDPIRRRTYDLVSRHKYEAAFAYNRREKYKMEFRHFLRQIWDRIH